MSYNGSGTFQINTSGQPVVTGTVISSSAFNALTADLATGLSTAITKDGQTATTVRIPFAQGINSSLATDTSSGSTGSIFTAGGVGIAKALYVGTNATVVGTLGVTGAATFSATPIFSALTASSAVATDASKNLVSVTNTGTGNNVLATSPTITTPTISQLTSAAATALTLQSAGTTAVTISTSQQVGIGTASPSVKFQVNHSSDVAAINASGGGVTLGMSNSSANDVLLRMTNNSSNFYDIRNISSSSNFSLDYNGTSRMTIDTSGSIFATSGVVCFTTSQYRSNVASSQLQFINNSAGVSLAVNGTSWGSLSDERDKEIIEPITDATSKVASLRSVIGRYKVDDADKRRAFLIAQDVKAVLPEAVTELEDEQQTLILQYTEVIPLLVAAIQEQQALITSLTARIAALEAK